MLGGRDFEMQTIRDLLQEHDVPFVDKGLSWGAKASLYADEIEATLSEGKKPVLVELELDLPLQQLSNVIVVDHHGIHAGKDIPTSLEQVFKLLQLPIDRWTRRLELVAANDRGHIRGMRQLEIPASDEEIRTIREGDLKAQGISNQELETARISATTVDVHCNGRLSVVQTTGRTGLVAEMMETFFGGPGFINLLVLGTEQAAFFGEGRWVQRLAHCSPPSPASWFGGALPEFGFWGGVVSELTFDPLAELLSALEEEDTSSTPGGESAAG